MGYHNRHKNKYIPLHYHYPNNNNCRPYPAQSDTLYWVPYQRALRKNIAGVIETPNGGVSFRNSDVIYIKNDGTKYRLHEAWLHYVPHL